MTDKITRFLESHTEEFSWSPSPIMAKYTSFHIGGRAKFLIYPHNTDALCLVVDLLEKNHMKYVVLGRMTNLLFTDHDYEGAVICTSKIKGMDQSDTHITANCGVTLAELCRFARDSSLSGLEFACGIPGSVGGGVYMNAGAGGHELSDVLVSVTYYDIAENSIRTVFTPDCQFSYRTSMFTKSQKKIILRAEFALKEGNMEAIRADMNARVAKRAESQPLEYPNAGSIFKRKENCIVSKLIDETGLKGLRQGDAEVSEKHAGFIVNRGNATAADVLTLIHKIKSIIREKHGITLEEEILFIE